MDRLASPLSKETSKICGENQEKSIFQIVSESPSAISVRGGGARGR